MGYACPVCETPQMDAEHLANHLAFTALLGDDAHEAWLDDHVPGWDELDESALGERVAPHASETDFPQVFEDTTGDSEHGDPPGERSGALFDDAAHAHDHGPADRQLDEETERVVAEARELTRRMLDTDGEREDGDEDDG